MPPERVVEEKSATERGDTAPDGWDGVTRELRRRTRRCARARSWNRGSGSSAMLGRGGMGEVYEAVDIALGTRVALKTVRFGQGSTEGRMQRFRREILLARRIAHPNVCRVFELHVGGSGRACRCS